MKRYRRILLVITLSAVMMLGCVCTASAAISEKKLEIAGVDIVKAENQTVYGTTGTAKLTYDEEGNPVLTLDNFTKDSGVLSCINYEDSQPLNIVLKNNNSMVSSNNVGTILSIEGDLIFSGDGELEVKNTNTSSITAYKGLTINSGTLTVISPDTTVVESHYGLTVHDDLIVNGGSLTVTGVQKGNFCSAGINAGQNVIVNRGVLKATGGNAQNFSYGIDIGKGAIKVATGATLTAESGTVSGDSGTSCGVHIESSSGGIEVSGTLTATGSDASRSSGTSYGISLNSGDIKVNGGTLTAVAGYGDNCSNGISSASGKIIVNSGTLTATAGKSASSSYGIYSGNIEVHGGTLTSVAADSDKESIGIKGGNLTVDGGELSGTAGDANNPSYGLDVKNITLDGGKLTGTGGSAKGMGKSTGISGTGITIKQGTLTAKGGPSEWDEILGTSQSRGIDLYATLDIQGGTVVASGERVAVDGKLKNSIPGTGWDDASGTGSSAAIQVSESGRSVSYKKIMFPTFVEYPLWVGGTQVTSANASDVLADDPDNKGKVSFTPANGTDPATLTLSGANITTGCFDSTSWYYGGIIYEGSTPLTIELASRTNNTVDVSESDKVFNCGIYCFDKNKSPVNLTITGEGSMTAKGKFTGITASDITINNGVVEAKAVDESAIRVTKSVTINGGTVTASGQNIGIIGIYDMNNEVITINGGEVTATGSVTAIDGIVVKNAIAGTGWSNVDGTEGKADIEISTEGQNLEDKKYKKVQFPAVVASVTSSGSTTPTNYDSLEAALNAWTDGSTLTLLKDVETTGAIEVKDNKAVTLDLNGFGIRYTGSSGSVITVQSGTQLTLQDSNTTAEHTIYINSSGRGVGVDTSGTTSGTGIKSYSIKGGYITGGTGTFDNNVGSQGAFCGGGVYVKANGENSESSFTMEGGTIIGNYGNSGNCGGGVFVCGSSNGSSSFTMKGGKIIGNTTYSGGGVYVIANKANSKSSFLMEGGTISGNTAYYGGGVYVFAKAGGNSSFAVKDGIINDNTANINGGGVYVNWGGNSNANFTMNGGTISGNTANTNGGGVFTTGVGTSAFNISGNPVIKGNKKGTGDDAPDSNVYLDDGKKIIVAGALTNNATIGVTMKTPGVFTSSAEGVTAKTYKEKFACDDTDYIIKEAENELKLAQPEITYIDPTNETQVQTIDNYTVVTDSTSWGKNNTETWYVLNAAAAENLTNSNRIYVNGTVNLILCDGAKLTANNGIEVYAGNQATLNIYGQTKGDGTLIATGGSTGNAGIGSSERSDCGNVNVYGGKLNATGGSTGGAGIGGGDGGYDGNVTIHGGNVIATGGEGAVGIGAGKGMRSNGTLTLGDGMYLYGGDTANPTTNIPKESGDYARYKYMVVNNIAPHEHSFTYNVSGATITATCANTDKKCELDDGQGKHTATLTIEADDAIYNGEAYTGAKFSQQRWTNAGLVEPNKSAIYYKGRETTTYNSSTTAPTNVGRYTASATVNGNVISKDFMIKGQSPAITYSKVIKNNNKYVKSTVITTQYVPLTNNSSGILFMKNGLVYAVGENQKITVGALVYEGNVTLVLCKGSSLTIRAGIYHIGSELEIYAAEGGEDAVITVEGNYDSLSNSAQKELTDKNAQDKNSILSGNISIYGGKISTPQEKDNLFSNDINLKTGVGINSTMSGGTELEDGSILYTKADLNGVKEISAKQDAMVVTAPTKKDGLVYDGTAQQLLNEDGEASGGVLQYALGINTTTKPDSSAYGETIPTGKEAKDYYVWYKVVGSNSETEPVCIETKINAQSGGGSSGGESAAETAQQVTDKINALPDVSALTLKDADAVAAALAEFNKLSEADKAKVSQETLKKLRDAEAKIAELKKADEDQKAAGEVSKQIEALPADPAKASEADAQAAFDAFMKLTDAQKALLSDDAKQKVAAYKYFYEVKYAEAQKVKMSSAKAKKGGKVVVKWKKNKAADGYRLYYKAKGVKAKYVNIKSSKTVKTTVKKLKDGKVYSFKVRSYTKVNDPSTGKAKKVYGKWSKAKKVRAKK